MNWGSEVSDMRYQLTAVGKFSPSPVYPPHLSRERNASEAEAELVAKFSPYPSASHQITASDIVSTTTKQQQYSTSMGREQQRFPRHQTSSETQRNGNSSSIAVAQGGDSC